MKIKAQEPYVRGFITLFPKLSASDTMDMYGVREMIGKRSEAIKSNCPKHLTNIFYVADSINELPDTLAWRGSHLEALKKLTENEYDDVKTIVSALVAVNRIEKEAEEDPELAKAFLELYQNVRGGEIFIQPDPIRTLRAIKDGHEIIVLAGDYLNTNFPSINLGTYESTQNTYLSYIRGLWDEATQGRMKNSGEQEKSFKEFFNNIE